MNKHAAVTLNPVLIEPKPEHSAGWSVASIAADWVDGRYPRTPGKHAKPFGKHHPANPASALVAAAPRKKKRARPTFECNICNDLATAA